MSDAVLLIEDPSSFTRVPYVGHRSGQSLFLKVTDGEADRMTLLQCSLHGRRTWDRKELRMAMWQFNGVDLADERPFKELLKELVDITFSSPETCAAVMSFFDKDDPDVEGMGDFEASCPMDKETEDPIVDLAIDEVDDAADLRRFTEEVNREALRTLAQRRAKARAKQVARRVKLREAREKRQAIRLRVKPMTRKRPAPASAAAQEQVAAPAPARLHRSRPQAQRCLRQLEALRWTRLRALAGRTNRERSVGAMGGSGGAP